MTTLTYNQAKQIISRYGRNWISHVSEIETPSESTPRILRYSASPRPPRQREPLSDEYLQRFVPSVFALEPWQKMSEKYRFIPTIKVIDAMRAAGIYPVSATQSNSRIPGKREFTKHSIRFRLTTDLLEKGDIVPEIQLINSHDGTASYRLYLGLYRCVCSNQMTVADKHIGSIRVIHRGDEDLAKQVIRASFKLIKQAHRIMDQVQSWKDIQLTMEQQNDFADRAIGLLGSQIEVMPHRVLAVRRAADRGEDLWTIFNRVQENLLRGGVYGRTTTGHRTSTREVKSIDRSLDINLGLWRLADRIARG